ncbi:hypothetical protein [Sphaerotilus sp.]|uniref:hypothetical protein n=1 Tax=Sphaerotilus sp. TaxID=2093942 RepID=UPI002ACDF0D0|nr:hypothetical protein [Sphaerotilus sp.]MDZ7855751.1 hypothetical protein [Sphaerotilus sp.]
MSCSTRASRCTCVLLGGNGRAAPNLVQARPVAALLQAAPVTCPRMAQAIESLRAES